MRVSDTADRTTEDLPGITVEPAVASCWPAVEQVLDQRGSVKGCWCMYYRVAAREWREGWGDGHRQALRDLVEAGARPGLVARRDGEPAGWVSVAPYEQFPRLARSPVSAPVDDQRVWSLVCLYVRPGHRRAGVARALVRAAIAFAREQGALIVEAYPVDDTLGPVSADHAFHGVVSLLAAEGFAETARRTPRRPVMRLALTGDTLT
jgi:GNAT superfamily N-acetyltransferase